MMDLGKLSFSFSKKVEKKALKPSALRSAPVNNETNAKEIIETIEENKIKSNLPKETELVIPLRQHDREASFKSQAKKKKKDIQQDEAAAGTEQKPETEMTLDERAESALLAEARGEVAGGAASGPANIALPAAGPGSLATGSLAPPPGSAKLSTLEDYDEVQVESFGAAMLRGMGWNKTEGVGNVKNRKVVSIIEASNRALGAEASVKGNVTAQQQLKGDEQLSLVKGAYILLHGGRNKGSYGTVEYVEDDHLMVRKAVGGTVLREVEANVTVVSQEHYKESSRVINKEMYDKFKTAETEQKSKKRSTKRKLSDSQEQQDNLKEQRKQERKQHDSPDSSNHQKPSHNDQKGTNNSKPENISDPVSRGRDAVADTAMKQESITTLHDSHDDCNNKEEIALEKRTLDDRGGACELVKLEHGSDSVREESRSEDDRNGNDDNHEKKRHRDKDLNRYKNTDKYSDTDKHRDSDGNENTVKNKDNEMKKNLNKYEDSFRDIDKYKNTDSYGKIRSSEDSDGHRGTDRRRNADRNTDRDGYKTDLHENSDRDEGYDNKKSDKYRSKNRYRERNSDRCREKDSDRYREKDSKNYKDNHPDSFSDQYSDKNNSKKSDKYSSKYSENNRKVDSDSSRNKVKLSKSGDDERSVKQPSNKSSIMNRYGDASMNAGAAAAVAPWAREGLTVRIISESYKSGRYFKQKVRVTSVLTASSCECSTADGRLLRGVPLDALETVIPKLAPRTVMVLRGPYAGQLGCVQLQHKDAEEASVQLLQDRGVIVRLSYEHICQYDT